MNTSILQTRPERLTLAQLNVLRASDALRDRYNARWNTSLHRPLAAKDKDRS